VSPKPDVFNAPTGDQGGFFNNASESFGVSSFPDTPGDSGDDCCFLVGPAPHCPKVGKAGGAAGVEVQEEETPDFPGAGTEEQHVVCIFVLGA
jgi:hypothetical protein